MSLALATRDTKPLAEERDFPVVQKQDEFSTGALSVQDPLAELPQQQSLDTIASAHYDSSNEETCDREVISLNQVNSKDGAIIANENYRERDLNRSTSYFTSVNELKMAIAQAIVTFYIEDVPMSKLTIETNVCQDDYSVGMILPNAKAERGGRKKVGLCGIRREQIRKKMLVNNRGMKANLKI